MQSCLHTSPPLQFLGRPDKTVIQKLSSFLLMSPPPPPPLSPRALFPQQVAKELISPQVDEPEVWSELGHSQLEANEVGDAIESYLRSADHSRHLEVIQRSTQAGAHAQLVKFLLMVRKKVKDPKASSPPPSPQWTCR